MHFYGSDMFVTILVQEINESRISMLSTFSGEIVGKYFQKKPVSTHLILGNLSLYLNNCKTKTKNGAK